MKYHPMSFTAWVLPSTELPRWPEHVPRAVLGVACSCADLGASLGCGSHTFSPEAWAGAAFMDSSSPPPGLLIHLLLMVLKEKKGSTTYLRGRTLRVT